MANIVKKWRRGRPGIEWSPSMIKELKKQYAAKSQKELAKHFGCTLSALKGAITRYGIDRKRVRGWNEKDDAYLLKNWTNYTKDDLASHFRKSRSAIIRRYNLLAQKIHND